MLRPFMFGAAALLLSLGFGCGDDPVTPDADKEVRVDRANYLPNSVEITPGAKVLWVNVLPRSAENERTVTSGTGPDDPEAGALFHATLRGYESGQPRGETFIFQFTERGTFPYFSRLPDGEEFSGTVIVR